MGATSMSGLGFIKGCQQEPAGASYLQARIDAVQDMFDELSYVSIDMVAAALGVSLEAYKARQVEITKEDLENDVD